ncbi:rab-GTPase-TBC domain-containing protein [Lipomyces kononenkoae]
MSPRHPQGLARPSAAGDFEIIALDDADSPLKSPRYVKTDFGTVPYVGPTGSHEGSALISETIKQTPTSSLTQVDQMKSLPPTPNSSSHSIIDKYANLQTQSRPHPRQSSSANLSPLPRRVSSISARSLSPTCLEREDGSSPSSSSLHLTHFDPEQDQALPLRRPQDRRSSSRLLSDEIDLDSAGSADEVDVPNNVIFWNVPLVAEAKVGSLGNSSSTVRVGEHDRSQRSSPVTDRQQASGTPDGTPSKTGPQSGQDYWNRPKGWITAMDNLSGEAKDLTVALEDYRDALRKSMQKQMAVRTSPQKVAAEIKPSEMEKSKSSKENISVNKDDMVEPVSLTRPSHLPRKTKHEEEKHLTEFRKMMQKSQEQERKKKEQLQQQIKDFYKRQNDDITYWSLQVMQQLPIKISEARTRELIWRSGIPAKDRERVWKLLIGNSLDITAKQFDKLVDDLHVKDRVEMAATSTIYKNILEEVENVYPETKLYQEGGPLHESLVDILHAYSVYNKGNVAYRPGMNTIAAALLLNLSGPDTFSALANLVVHQSILAFYKSDKTKLSKFYNAFDIAFATHLPSFRHHFVSVLGIPCEVYLDALIVPLFTLHLPMDFIPRLWDIVFLEILIDFPSPTSTNRVGPNASTSPSSFEALLIAIVLAFFKHLNTSLLVSDRDTVMRTIGWRTAPVKFEHVDAGIDVVTIEIEFIRNMRSFL